MQSLKFLYKIGRGPSSSHTMGPYVAALKIKNQYSEADKYVVTLYNSLALTGDGHLTYGVIKETLAPIEVEFKTLIDISKHPNTMIFEVYQKDKLIDTIEVKSIGGGEILIGDEQQEKVLIYPHKNFAEIKKYCLNNNIDLYQYVKEFEGQDIDDFLRTIWEQMKSSIHTGLSKEGILPGKLQVKRKARDLFLQRHEKETPALKENRLISAYAFSVNEENASGGLVVTSPTCGSAGILPAVLYYMYENENVDESKIIRALAIGGLFGNICKHNATISGAVGGCQAEVGVACSMAAAAHASLFKSSIDQMEYAAEIAIEHNLGLTCDPVDGYVQIPCIERNAVGAIRAMSASQISYFLSGSRKISFDMIVKTMYQTGLDMHPKYKETAEAGMAYFYRCGND